MIHVFFSVSAKHFSVWDILSALNYFSLLKYCVRVCLTKQKKKSVSNENPNRQFFFKVEKEFLFSFRQIFSPSSNDNRKYQVRTINNLIL